MKETANAWLCLSIVETCQEGIKCLQEGETMTTFSYTLTLTDSDHIWLERIITSVIEDPTNDIRLRGAARELMRKVRTAEEDAIMLAASNPCWPDTPES